MFEDYFKKIYSMTDKGYFSIINKFIIEGCFTNKELIREIFLKEVVSV